jgi:hypothetical protein
MSGRKPECEDRHHRIERQVPEQLASRLESLWTLIASETSKRRTPERQVQSPKLGAATQRRRRGLRCSPGSSRTARPTICPARVRQSSLRSAYYLLTISRYDCAGLRQLRRCPPVLAPAAYYPMVPYLPMSAPCWLVQIQKQRACQLRKLAALQRRSSTSHESALPALADFMSGFAHLERA